MDYPKDGVQIKWSTCSHEDFEELYNTEMDKYNKYGLDTLVVLLYFTLEV